MMRRAESRRGFHICATRRSVLVTSRHAIDVAKLRCYHDSMVQGWFMIQDQTVDCYETEAYLALNTKLYVTKHNSDLVYTYWRNVQTRLT